MSTLSTLSPVCQHYFNIVPTFHLAHLLRIQFKLNTALLSTVRVSVRSCVTGVTSHISHIYKGINAMLIIRGPNVPYTFWIKIILAIFFANTTPDKTILSGSPPWQTWPLILMQNPHRLLCLVPSSFELEICAASFIFSQKLSLSRSRRTSWLRPRENQLWSCQRSSHQSASYHWSFHIHMYVFAVRSDEKGKEKQLLMNQGKWGKR